MVLVERAGEVVTKDELCARVWPGLKVDEGNLRTQIALVRKALRDGQAGARYVMTVPGRGYRFVAPFSTAKTSKPIELRTSPTAALGLPVQPPSATSSGDCTYIASLRSAGPAG
jgi:DNA-binding winged helix-turn-helix (wHTH) protein